MKRLLLSLLALALIPAFQSCGPLDGSAGGDPLDSGNSSGVGSLYYREGDDASTDF